MKTRILIAILGIIAIGCKGEETPPTTTTTTTTGGAEPATTGATAATGAFAEVAQVATANCMPCHNAQNKAGGLSLATYADMMKGGESGAVVVAGDPDNSLIIKVLHGPVTTPEVPRMPLKRDPLPEATIHKLADWIKAGAKEA